jgi:DNA modification methylase
MNANNDYFRLFYYILSEFDELDVCYRYDDDGEGAKFQSHPNHKPFTVLEPLLRAHSRVGDVVFEPFAGSGSTLAAAHKLKRHVAGLELDERWASVARHRLSSM